MDDYGCILLLTTAVAQYSNMSDNNPYKITLDDVYVKKIEKTKKGFYASIATTVADDVEYEAFYEWSTKAMSLRVLKQIDKFTINLGEY